MEPPSYIAEFNHVRVVETPEELRTSCFTQEHSMIVWPRSTLPESSPYYLRGQFNALAIALEKHLGTPSNNDFHTIEVAGLKDIKRYAGLESGEEQALDAILFDVGKKSPFKPKDPRLRLVFPNSYEEYAYAPHPDLTRKDGLGMISYNTPCTMFVEKGGVVFIGEGAPKLPSDQVQFALKNGAKTGSLRPGDVGRHAGIAKDGSYYGGIEPSFHYPLRIPEYHSPRLILFFN